MGIKYFIKEIEKKIYIYINLACMKHISFEFRY